MAEKSILIYGKNSSMKKFKAISSLKKMTFAPTLMYACLIPYEKLDALKKWCNDIEELCKKSNVKIELRQYKGKTLYKIG